MAAPQPPAIPDPINLRVVQVAGDAWGDRYRAFCQPVYAAVYPRPEKGITADLFSPEVFATPGLVAYFRRLSTSLPDQRLWMALDADGNILGGIAAVRHPTYCEMKGFYVAPDSQSHGVGRRLFTEVVAFADTLPLQLDVVHYLEATLALYERWGFRIVPELGTCTYPWDAWTDEQRATWYGVFMARPVTIDQAM